MTRSRRATCWSRGAMLALAAGIGCAGPIKDHGRKTAKAGPPRALQGADGQQTGVAMRLTINDESVGVDELWSGLRDELRVQAKNLTPGEYRDYVKRRAAVLIRDRITEALLYQRAKLRLTPDIQGRVDGFVDGEIRKTVTTDYDGRQARYEKKLEADGQTLDDVRDKLRREVIITSYLEAEVKPKVDEPTRGELWHAFQAAADSLRRAPRRRMSLIDVRKRNRLPAGVSAPTPEQLETAGTEARSRAETALSQIRSGVAFADVAKQYSDGLHAAEGGAWGWIAPNSVRKRFEPAVLAAKGLPVGGVSEIIESGDDLFIVHCDEIDPGYEPDFQTEQPRLRDEITRAAYNGRIMDLVQELQSKARIEPADLAKLHAALVEAAPSQEKLLAP